MAITFSIGVADFERIITDGSYFVDKSMFISKVIHDNSGSILITRPRRFGKTIVLSMLSSFLDIRKESSALFKELEIMKDKEIVSSSMNQFPVIFISFKDIADSTFESALYTMKVTLRKLFRGYSFLADSLSEKDKRLFLSFCDNEGSLDDVKFSLQFLVEILESYYHKTVYILIDEYDVPLAKAEENGFYHEMLDLMRGLFRVIKDDTRVEKAVLTGCLKISKESLFTGLNNFSSYSLLSSEYADSIGFTEKEVDKILKDTGLEEKKETIKSWYDGYNIGGISIYSSWDVAKYVKALLYSKDAEPESYWAKTSGNDIIRKFIEITDASIDEEYSSLINGGSIEKRLNENLTYPELYKSEENIWSLMFETGYLTLKEAHRAEKDDVLIIPNREVKDLFITEVDAWFKDSVQSNRESGLGRPDIIIREKSNYLRVQGCKEKRGCRIPY